MNLFATTLSKLPAADTHPDTVVYLSDVAAGGSFWKSDGVDWFPVGGVCVLYSGGPSGVITDPGEVTFSTVGIPPLTGLAGTIRVTPLFKYSNSAVAKTFRVRIGGTVVCTVAVSTTSSVQFISLTRAQGAINSQISQASSGSALLGAVNSSPVATTIDLSVAQNLTITGEIASGTSDNIQLLGWVVELLKA